MKVVSWIALVVSTLLLAPALAQDSPPPFTLSSSAVAGGDSVTISFAAPLPASEGRHWVCIVKPEEADSVFGVWSYVDADATRAELKAPEIDGTYEVRLHANYPAQSHHVIHRETLIVTGLQPTQPEDIGVTVPAAVPVDAPIPVDFKAALVPESGERFWIAIVPVGAPDTAQGRWTMVPATATRIEVPAATSSGDHEIRLHGNYPTQSSHVVARAPLKITGAEATLPTPFDAIEATLGATSLALGQAPTVRFNLPLRPVTGQTFSIGIAHAGLPETAQGLPTSIAPGSNVVTLQQPISTGKHRIQLIGSSPGKPREVVATLELDVTGEPADAPTDTTTIQLSLSKATLAAGEPPVVDFGTPLRARTGERFWATVVPQGTGDSEWGQFAYVPVAAGQLELPAPEAAGAYEVRLHAHYPTQSSNVVARTPLTVE